MTSPAATGPLSIEYWPLAKCQRAPRNPKAHDIGAIHASVQRFGYTMPLAINETTGRLVGGHGRLEYLEGQRTRGEAAPRRIPVDGMTGEWLVPVIRGLAFATDAEAEAYLVADNQLTILGGWEDGMLADVLRDQAERGPLHGIGFDGEDLDDLLRRLQEPAHVRPTGRMPAAEVAQRTWGVAVGDVWEIPSLTVPGKAHRVVCGDARHRAPYQALLPGERAALIYTDPPYGVNYQQGAVRHDNLAGDPFAAFLELAFRQLVAWSIAEAPFYNHWQHEPCFYAAKAEQRPRWYAADREQSTVWRIAPGRGEAAAPMTVALGPGIVLSTGRGGTLYLTPRVPKARAKRIRVVRPGPGQAVVLTGSTPTDTWEVVRDPVGTYTVPTQKPAALAERALENSSAPGDLVLDAFAGSGSTLVACEPHGRLARLLELEPAVTAVVLARAASLGLAPTRTGREA